MASGGDCHGEGCAASTSTFGARKLPGGFVAWHWRPNRVAHQTQATPTCASPRSSLSEPTSTRFSSTLGWTQKLRASPRHTGHRCGMTVVRRYPRIWAKVLRLCRIGTWQTNHRPITLTISALRGEPDKCGCNRPSGRGCVHGQPRVPVATTGGTFLENQAGEREGASCMWPAYPARS